MLSPVSEDIIVTPVLPFGRVSKHMAQQRRGGFKRRKKVDYIAANKIEYVDYKDTELLSRFVSERGKILPRRVTGTSAKNQRKVTTAIKRARVMALMPFVNED